MDTKTYLNQIIVMDEIIQNRLSDIHNLRLMASGIGCGIENERVQTSTNGDAFTRLIDKIVDMEREVDESIDKRLDIIRQIETMNNAEERKILNRIFVKGQRFDKIAEEMNYSKRQIIRKYKKAMKNFEESYGDAYINKNMSLNATECP